LIAGYLLAKEQYKAGTNCSQFGESHYRELGQLKTKQYRVAAVQEVLHRFGDSPTAANVQEVVDEILGKRRPRKKPFIDIETHEEKQEQNREAQAEGHWDQKSREANEDWYMKPKYIEEDVNTIIERFGEYTDSKTVCDLVIEAAARRKQQADLEQEAGTPGSHQEPENDEEG
jgi:hypothetical protein